MDDITLILFVERDGRIPKNLKVFKSELVMEVLAIGISEGEKGHRRCSVQFELWSNIKQEMDKGHLESQAWHSDKQEALKLEFYEAIT